MEWGGLDPTRTRGFPPLIAVTARFAAAAQFFAPLKIPKTPAYGCSGNAFRLKIKELKKKWTKLPRGIFLKNLDEPQRKLPPQKRN